MKLKAFLAGKSQTNFDVKKTEYQTTESTGEKIALLYLVTPIELVEGSQVISEEAGGEAARIQAYDVEVVRVHERDFEADGIDIKEDGTGKVNCDLRLDVSSAGDVWLTSKSFATFGREKRQENANKRRSGIIDKMKERKAAALLKNADATGTSADKPEPVATGK